MIKLKINVKAIDKSKLFVGEKGTYLDAVLIPTPNSKYGDFMIVQEITKAERDAGKKGAILGSAKNWGRAGDNEVSSPKEDPKAPTTGTASDDDSSLPF